jgi:hypothetical protein
MGHENSARHDQPTPALGKESAELSLGQARSPMGIKLKESVQRSFRPADRACVSCDGRKESARTPYEVRSSSEIFAPVEPSPLPNEPPIGRNAEGTEFPASVCVGVYWAGAGLWVPEAETV